MLSNLTDDSASKSLYSSHWLLNKKWTTWKWVGANITTSILNILLWKTAHLTLRWIVKQIVFRDDYSVFWSVILSYWKDTFGVFSSSASVRIWKKNYSSVLDRFSLTKSNTNIIRLFKTKNITRISLMIDSIFISSRTYWNILFVHSSICLDKWFTRISFGSSSISRFISVSHHWRRVRWVNRNGYRYLQWLIILTMKRTV